MSAETEQSPNDFKAYDSSVIGSHESLTRPQWTGEKTQ